MLDAGLGPALVVVFPLRNGASGYLVSGCSTGIRDVLLTKIGVVASCFDSLREGGGRTNSFGVLLTRCKRC